MYILLYLYTGRYYICWKDVYKRNARTLYFGKEPGNDALNDNNGANLSNNASGVFKNTRKL